MEAPNPNFLRIVCQMKKLITSDLRAPAFEPVPEPVALVEVQQDSWGLRVAQPPVSERYGRLNAPC
jgi:hypothetical protein